MLACGTMGTQNDDRPPDDRGRKIISSVRNLRSDFFSGAVARRRWFLPALVLFSLIVFTVFFVKGFTGIHGDGVFYYSYTVSLLWDHDFDLKNQFDTPDPRTPGETYSHGLYSIDKKTGKALSTFNMGAGLIMLPAVAGGKLFDRMRGGRHPDPFDLYYQRIAGFTAVVVSALTILFLFLILNRYFSFGTALCLPFLFITGSNWLFYMSVFATWSHVYALFLFAFMIWAFLTFLEKKTVLAALLFGLAGGLSFVTRNFAALTFLFLFLYAMFDLGKDRRTIPSRRAVVLLALAGLLFLASASPQLIYNEAVHGSAFRTSWQAAAESPEAFGLFAKKDFKVLEPDNLQFLYSGLWNSDDGLFYFHPFYLVGLLGVLLLKHRNGRFQALNNLLLANVFIFWFVDAAYFDTWFSRAAGAGFGHRRYLDMLPFFIFGAAAVLEWSRRRKLTKAAAFIIFAALTAAGAALIHEFLAHYGAYYAVRDSFVGLYGYLLGSRLGVLFFAVVFMILLVLIRKDRTTGQSPWAGRGFLTVLVFAALFILPAFVFRADPDRDRQRFQDMGGIFLVCTRTPMVGLPGRDWGQPENGARPMLSSSADIILPAPLFEDDRIDLRLTPLFSGGRTRGIMNVRMGRESIGRIPVKEGPQTCEVRVPPAVPPGRRITIQFESENPRLPGALLHEGRIVFRERDEPPFGYVDFPPDRSIVESGEIKFEGWALDDRRVAGFVAKRAPFEGEPNPPGDDDGLIPLASAEFREKARPDMEKVYVMYPAIDRAGWEFRLDRGIFPKKVRGPLIVVVFAVDDAGPRAEVGRRELILADTPDKK